MISYSQYFIGDDAQTDFVHLAIKVLPGRTKAIKDIAAHKLFALLEQVMQDLEMMNISISVEGKDLSEHYYKTTL